MVFAMLIGKLEITQEFGCLHRSGATVDAPALRGVFAITGRAVRRCFIAYRHSEDGGVSAKKEEDCRAGETGVLCGLKAFRAGWVRGVS